jgi:DNA invertase Pin-like site-specific DNA recombinase
MRSAIYARVSTLDQHVENQLQELRSYVERRGWTAVEFVDRGVSGAKDRRPALDDMLKAARQRRFDVLVCWRLDRLGRNLRHLILLLDELQALGIAFVTLGEGIDTSTPAGRLQLHILSAIAEFERSRIQERVMAGLARAKAQGKRLGRPERQVPEDLLAPVRGLSVREAGVAVTVVSKILGHTNLSTTSRYLNIHRRGLHAAMQKLGQHRPAVAQPLHNKEKNAQAGVPAPDTSAPAETSRLQ